MTRRPSIRLPKSDGSATHEQVTAVIKKYMEDSKLPSTLFLVLVNELFSREELPDNPFAEMVRILQTKEQMTSVRSLALPLSLSLSTHSRRRTGSRP